jgi:transcriptional regulator with XRE-family HTH domain
MDLKEVGPRIRALRERRGWSQGDIERKTGMLRCYLSRLENGHTRPSLESLEKICMACGVTLFQFFDDGRERAAGPALSDAEREFLIQVQRASSKLTAREKGWMLEMVKKFSHQLSDGPIPPKSDRSDLAVR